MSLDNVSVCILAGGTGHRMYPLSITYYNSTKIYYDHSILEKHLLQSTYSFWNTFTHDIYTISIDDIFLGKDVYDSIILYLENVLYKDPNAILILSVADCYINSNKDTNKQIEQALDYVSNNDMILSLLAKPNRIKAGNFYTLVSNKNIKNNIYKPYKTVMISSNIDNKKYTKEYDFYWSAGVWIGKAYVFADRIKKLKRNIWLDIDKYKVNNPVSFGIKTKYNIFEHDPDLLVMPMKCGWIDLGTWGSIWYAMPRDEYGVATKGQYYSYKNHNTLIYNTTDKSLIGACLDGSAVIMTDYGATVLGDKDNEKAARIQGDYGNKHNRERGMYDKKEPAS